MLRLAMKPDQDIYPKLDILSKTGMTKNFLKTFQNIFLIYLTVKRRLNYPEQSIVASLWANRFPIQASNVNSVYRNSNPHLIFP